MVIMMKKGNVLALLPIGIFIALYLGLGITFEYFLKIPMGFYKVPIVVIFFGRSACGLSAKQRNKL